MKSGRCSSMNWRRPPGRPRDMDTADWRRNNNQLETDVAECRGAWTSWRAVSTDLSRLHVMMIMMMRVGGSVWCHEWVSEWVSAVQSWNRVNGSTGQWFCRGRVGSRVKVIYLQIRYREPVSDRTTEWYSSCFYAGNTWTHCAMSQLNEHAPLMHVAGANCLTVGPLPCRYISSISGRLLTTLLSSNDISNPSTLLADYYVQILLHMYCNLRRRPIGYSCVIGRVWAQFLNGWQDYSQRSSVSWQIDPQLEASVLVTQAIKKNLLTCD